MIKFDALTRIYLALMGSVTEYARYTAPDVVRQCQLWSEQYRNSSILFDEIYSL